MASSSNAAPNVCIHKITSVDCMEHWTMKCPGYKDIVSFVTQLNGFGKGAHSGLYDPTTIKEPYLVDVAALLENLTSLADSVEPFKDDKGQRFGNKAYRLWWGKMKTSLELFFNEHPNTADELATYLLECFGHYKRIDYGTGHELSFIIFLLGVYKCILTPNDEATSREVSQQMLTLFAACYLPLCRKLQTRYQLEPAGSHGAFSLDDFQFLPFVFGSAQLIGHPKLEPRDFPDAQLARTYAPKCMFMAAIDFIHQVKKGPFAEHSNKLWNISGVESWAKINNGLLRMYEDEVLKKFPVVQHLLFGKNVLKWS